jgi:hypothetical protein
MRLSGGQALADGSTAARRRLDGGNTYVFFPLGRKRKRVPFGVPSPYAIIDTMVAYGDFIFA